MEFSKNQQLLIDSMIEQDSESIRDFYGDSAGYDIFLHNRKITPDKEIVINNILKNARNLNPYTNEGFNKPELQKIKNHFHTYKRKLSYIQPRPSTHNMTSRSIRKKIRSAGKTKKKKKKNKKKKRRSYKK
jgi:hypothetical protein